MAGLVRNTERNNVRFGQQYRVVNAPGGSWHVYQNGQPRVFVPAARPKPPAAGVRMGGSAAAAPPAAPRAAPAAAPTAPQSPYAPDAQYYADSAQDEFSRQGKLGDLGQQSAYDATDLQEALRRMRDQQPRDVQHTQEAAAKQGLFYSSRTGEQVGDVNASYARQESDAQQAYDRREAGRQAARTALEQGKSVDEAARLAESIDRQVTRDTTAADAGVLATNPGPAKPKPKAKPTSKTGVNPSTGERFTVVTVGGKTYHYYPNRTGSRRRVRVGK
jgi:hypothetical protein